MASSRPNLCVSASLHLCVDSFVFVNPNSGPAANEDAACDECGSFGALEIGDHRLCAECVTLAGSACAGSPSDDGG